MALGERLYHTYLIHFILLQYHSLSQQDLFLLPAANLISLQIAAIRFAAPICFSSFRTLFSENVLTIKMPRAMMQLAKMQMEQFLSWPSFTCSGETGKMRGGGNSCVPGLGRHGMMYGRSLLLSRGCLLFVMDRGTLQLQWQDFIYFYGMHLHRVETNLVKHSELSGAE